MARWTLRERRHRSTRSHEEGDDPQNQEHRNDLALTHDSRRVACRPESAKSYDRTRSCRNSLRLRRTSTVRRQASRAFLAAGNLSEWSACSRVASFESRFECDSESPATCSRNERRRCLEEGCARRVPSRWESSWRANLRPGRIETRDTCVRVAKTCSSSTMTTTT